MAIDIGTGVINIEIDRRQLRAEALQASRQLARTRTELRPQINVREFGVRLRQAIAAASTRDVWRPFEETGLQAMNIVTTRGIVGLSAIEQRGLVAASRLRAAFATIRIPPQNFGAGVAGAPGAVPRVAPVGAAGGGGRGGGLGTFTLGGLAGSLTNLDGEVGQLAQGVGAVTQSFATMGPAAAAVAAGFVGLGIGFRRFRQFGGFEGFNEATGGNILRALGFHRAGLERRERFDEREAGVAGGITGAEGDLANAQARQAREAEKNASQSQQARGARERNLQEEIATSRRLIAARQQRIQQEVLAGRGEGRRARNDRAYIAGQTRLIARWEAEINEINARTNQSKRTRQVETDRERTLRDLIQTNRNRIADYTRRRERAQGAFFFPGIRTAELEISIESSQKSIDEYERELRGIQARRQEAERAQADTAEAAAAQGAADNDLNRRERRERREFRNRLRLLNEQQIDSVSEQAEEARRQADLLRGKTTGDAQLQAQHARQSARYIEAFRAQAVEAKRGEIFQRRQAGAIRRQLLQTEGLTRFERLAIRFEGLQSVLGAVIGGLAIFAAATAIGAAAFYAAARVINAAARRFEEVQAAQIAAASIAQRTIRPPGDAAVDIQQVQAGIRAGAAGGLSQLTVARTAIDAIRTGSQDIFLNTEQVLRDLRVVAAATGVAFEDATTRFFRGIIKREQELLDELGIVARVEAANERYARSINVAASQLTPYQQQLAFANEVYRQLQVSANAFGQDAVLSTQRATEASNRLGAVWSDLFSDFGAQTTFLSQGLSFLGIGIAENLRRLLSIRRQRSPEVAEVTGVNRAEAERNRLIQERLGLISKQAIQGGIDVQQQRNLIELQREVILQQGRLFGTGPAGTAAGNLSRANAQAAQDNLVELEGIQRNLRDARSRGRIAGLQGPAIAALTAIESFGFAVERLPEGLRLSADHVARLTENTEEANFARAGLAAQFGVSISRIEELIPAMVQLNEERNKSKKAADDERLSLNQMIAERQKAIASGDFLREQYLALSRLLPDNLRIADAARIAQGGPESVFRLPEVTGFPADAAARAGITAREPFTARTGPIVELTQIDQFSLRAAEFGLTLDTMTSNLSSFVEGITLEGQNLQQALAAFLRNIARTLIQGASQNLGQQLLGGLFTNVASGQPSSGLSLQDVNEASQRTGAYQRVGDFYEGVG